jgi:transposase-like protein
MRKSEKTVQEQEAIISEYLLGDTTYRKLGVKHGVDFRVVHGWVTKFQGKPMKKETPKIKSADEHPQEELPMDVKQLQEELRKAKLHNKLLNAIIDIAEDRLKIDIRKKSGTKQ